MPSLTQSFPRKRRRDEADIEGELHLAIPQGFHDRYPHDHPPQHHSTSPRKPISILSPLSKKIRMTTAPASEWQNDEDQLQPTLAPACRPNRALSAASSKHSPPRAAPTNLSPCHICHRRPTKKTELDSFADCEGCGERTCYVCIRECLGWRGASPLPTPTTATTTTYDGNDDKLMRDDHEESRADAKEDNDHVDLDQSFSMEDAPSTEGAYPGAPQHGARRVRTWGQAGGRGHRGRICSQCCVEEGQEGEVICLGCLGT